MQDPRNAVYCDVWCPHACDYEDIVPSAIWGSGTSVTTSQGLLLPPSSKFYDVSHSSGACRTFRRPSCLLPSSDVYRLLTFIRNVSMFQCILLPPSPTLLTVQHDSLNYQRISNRLRGVTFQQSAIFIVTAVRTSSVRYIRVFYSAKLPFY
jgi:hypothetical protein